MSKIRYWVYALVGMVILSGLTTAGIAAPKAKLWDRWTQHEPGSIQTIDHSPWQMFLDRYVHASEDNINRVAYAAVSKPDRSVLDAYLLMLSQTAISQYPRIEQRAFWINAYNALTVQVILDHYPVESIFDIDISPGFLSNGPWGKKLIVIEGEKIGLDDIEHRILRPIWQDPRVHYAVNCASIGCPNLSLTAFTVDNADALLDHAAKQFVNHPRGSRVTNGELVVSSIYTWFQADFGGNDRGVIQHLRRYAKPELQNKLTAIEHIADDQYDWTLNVIGDEK